MSQARDEAVIAKNMSLADVYADLRNVPGHCADARSALESAILRELLAASKGQVHGDASNRYLTALTAAYAWMDAQEQADAPPTFMGEPAPTPDAQLLKFYDATDYASLVAAMEHHIERLQAKVPRDNQPAFTRVREG